VFVVERLLTPIRFTRCGPRHVVASRIIPSLTTSLPYLTFFAYREIFIPFLSPPHSPVLSRLLQRGAPRAVPSPPLPSRSVKLVEDFLPMILVVYVFHWGTYPTFVRISVVSSLFQECVRTSMLSLLLFPGRSRLIRPVPRARPTCSTTRHKIPDWRWRLTGFTSALDYLRLPNV